MIMFQVPSSSSQKKGRERAIDAIPATTSLLRWVYVGRMCVAVVVFGAAAFQFTAVSPGRIVTVAAAALLTVIVTGLSIYYTHVRGARPTHNFLYLQNLFDIALVTTVVHVTGGVNSDFASLYILVIAVSAVSMPFGSTMLVTAVAAILYIADSVWGYPVTLTLSLWLQIGVFVVVAVATGWLASRVRVVGARHKALVREVKRLRLEAADILREISGGIVTVDGDGALVYANASAERLLGFSAREHRGNAVMELLGERSATIASAILRSQRDRIRQVRVEGSVSHGGRTFPIGVTTTLHPADGEDHPSVTAIFTDISDQKRLNELNMRAERLEAVAALSASLAHEIKNPLASIRSSVEQLGSSSRANEDDQFLAQLIVRESDRLSRLLSEFLDFSRVQITESHSVDLNMIAHMAVELAREHPECPPDARIDVQGTETRLQGDEDLLYRVVFNLVLNALQATGRNAAVTVETRMVEPGEVPGGVSPEMQVVLSVADNGPGIPEHITSHLFDPFVTGREGGTGLGLAIVQRAVEAHRGVVIVDSEPEGGTRFSIFLPPQGAKEVAA